MKPSNPSQLFEILPPRYTDKYEQEEEVESDFLPPFIHSKVSSEDLICISVPRSEFLLIHTQIAQPKRYAPKTTL
jgi:hypothetical protein